MRRRLIIASLFALAALVAAVAIFGGRGKAPRGAAAPEAAASAVAPSEREARPTPAIDPGFLQGIVIGVDGAPAPGSEVRALDGGATVAQAIAGADGTFRLGPLRPGDLVVAARDGALASEPVGPIPLAPGEELGGIDLHLVPGGSLAGTILDAATGEPIEAAVARAAGLASSTDRLGRFLLQGLPAGEVAFLASAKGYEPRSETIAIGSGPTAGLEIRLTKGARIAGRVVNGSGEPVAGASVFTIEYRLREAERRLAGVTGASGAFDVLAPAGQVIVEAVDPAGGTGRTDVVGLSPGAIREGVEIRIAEAASLEGNVVDGSGEPVAGAQVYAAAGDRLFGGVATDGEGRFAMGGIPPGSIQVVATSGGARARVGPLEILEGEPVRITLQLGNVTLRGRVVDASGRQVPGASVAVWPEGGPRALATIVAADRGGAFEARELPGGPLRVEASSGALRGERRGVVAAAGEIEVAIAGAELVGLVLREGRPATEFAIAAAPLAPGAAGGTVQAFFSADGRFRLPLAPGEWEVRASAPGATEAIARVLVPESGASVEAVLDLGAGGVIEGQVVSAEDGAPIEGARVSVRRSGTFAFAQEQGLPGAPHAITGADGRFRLAGVEAGRNPVFAFHPGHRPARPAVVEVQAGRAARAEIRLAKGDAPAEESFGGIGLTLGTDRRRAVIAAEVVVGGPAFTAGVRRGDSIVAVDGAPLPEGAGLGYAVARIRGPVGAPVSLDLVRDGVRFRAIAVRAELRY